jgi:hypothetical protein
MATNNRKRTGQNDKVFSLKTTPGAGRRTNPKASKPAAKPADKPAAKSAAKPKVADYSDAQGNTYDGNTGRLKSSAKPAAKPSPKPSTRPSSAPAPARGSTPTKPAEKVPSSASKTSSSNVGPVASGDEYARNKDPKKYNPLMQKTFGYQKGDSPQERNKREDLERAKSDANKAKIKQGPPAPASPAQPASPNDPKKSAVQKSNNLMEELRKRRTNQ